MPMFRGKHRPNPEPCQVASAAETPRGGDERQNRYQAGIPAAQRVQHANDKTRSTTVPQATHYNSQFPEHGGPADFRPTTRHTAEAIVGCGAKSVTVDGKTWVSGSRLTGATPANAMQLNGYSNSGHMPTGLGGQADSRRTTRRSGTLDAKVGYKARNMTVEGEASLSATAGGRVVGNTAEEVVTMSAAAREADEKFNGERRADIFGDSDGVTVRGEAQVEATAGVHMSIRGQKRRQESDAGSALARTRNSRK